MIVNQELYMHRQHENQITSGLKDFYKDGHIATLFDIEKYRELIAKLGIRK